MSHRSREDAAVRDGRRRLREVAGGLCRRGWCPATSGNLSLVVSDDPQRLLVTRRGSDLAALEDEDLLLVDGAGTPLPGESGPPSAETSIHCAVTRRTDARLVLHTHTVAGTLVGLRYLDRDGLVLTGYELLKALRGITTHEAHVFLPVLANTQDMEAFGHRVDAMLTDRPHLHGFLIAGHGLYTWGRDEPEAHRHLEALEFLLRCVRELPCEPARRRGPTAALREP